MLKDQMRFTRMQLDSMFLEKYNNIRYIVIRIEENFMKYTDVIAKYPELKEAIDADLRNDGFENLIVEI